MMALRRKLAAALCLVVGSSTVLAQGATGAYWADIIAVEQNPLQDVRVLQHVNFVMKSGVVYKNETCKQEAACR
jgi:hypothetical protein